MSEAEIDVLSNKSREVVDEHGTALSTYPSAQDSMRSKESAIMRAASRFVC